MSAIASLAQAGLCLSPIDPKKQQTALGSYSYRGQNEKRFQCTTTGSVPQTFYPKIVPVNENIAALQFHRNRRRDDRIAVSAGFSMQDVGRGASVNPFMGCFFITWVADALELRYEDAPILNFPTRNRNHYMEPAECPKHSKTHSHLLQNKKWGNKTAARVQAPSLSHRFSFLLREKKSVDGRAA